jgi:hypothetical protein
MTDRDRDGVPRPSNRLSCRKRVGVGRPGVPGGGYVCMSLIAILFFQNVNHMPSSKPF